MATAAKRQKLVDKANALSKGVEVQLTQDNYNSDLLRALNYYNSNHDDKEKKKWFISHYAKIDKKIAVECLKVDEYHFRYAGILARLQDGGSVLQEKELNYFNERIKVIKELISQKKEPVVVKTVVATPTVSIQERMDEKAHELAGEIEGAIDDYVLNRTDFSAKNYLMANNVSAPIAKRIGEFYVKLYNELADTINGEDEQLTEGYSHFNKRELKAFHKFVGQIIED